MNPGYQLRLASAADSAAIATLAAELGYPAAAGVMIERLNFILADRRALVAVASQADGNAAGWIHAHLVQCLESDLRAEIGGVIIGAAHRRHGIGGALVRAVAHWAAHAGARCVTVRCNLVRPEAHRFYEHLGFTVTKQQLVFRQPIPSNGPFPSTWRLSEL